MKICATGNRGYFEKNRWIYIWETVKIYVLLAENYVM